MSARLSAFLKGHIALVAATCLAGPAFAQQEDIIVTAQKRAENLQDVPISVNAFTGSTLENIGVTGVQSLQFATPGLVFNRTGPSAQPYIRGIGTRLSQGGLEPSVAVYLDGRYEPLSSAVMAEMADVERVEVLKGPQGTLYGRNATAGAIRIISKEVSDELEGQFSAGYGNYDYYTASASVNVPLTDSFGTRITGMLKKRDAFAKNRIAGARDADDLDRWALRGKFRLEAGDNVTANLTLAYWKQDDAAGLDQIDLSPQAYSTGISRGGITGRNRGEIASVLDAIQRSDQFSAEFRVDVELGDIDLASITTFADYDGYTTIDADGTSARVFDAPGSVTSAQNFSQELQLVSGDKTGLEWIVGAYYFHGKSQTDNKLDAGGPLLLSTGNQRNITDAFAIFGQATWHFDDQWSLTAGGRLGYERKSVSTRKSTAVPGATLALVPFDDKADWTSFTPKLTLQYDMGDAMVYLAYARGFKSGGYNYPAKNAAGVGSALNPETLDMIELGVKGDFFDRRVRANVAAYAYDYKDLQVTRASTQGSGSVTSVTENAANARIYGLDADVNWSVTDHFTLTSGLNLSHSEYRDFLTTAKMFNAVATGAPAVGMRDVAYNASGHALLRSPDWSAFISAEYDLPLANGAHVPINLSYSYKDDYDFDFIADPSSGRLRQKAYGLLNARITYVSANDNWRLAAWAQNLTDVHYFDDVVGTGAGIRASYGAPRTYGVDFTYRF